MKYRLKEVDAMKYDGDVEKLLGFLGESHKLVARDDRSVAITGGTYTFTLMLGSYAQKTQGRTIVHAQTSFEAMYEPAQVTEITYVETVGQHPKKLPLARGKKA